MASDRDIWKDFFYKRSGTITVNEVRTRAWCPGKDWSICGVLTPKKFWAHELLERNRVLCEGGFRLPSAFVCQPCALLAGIFLCPQVKLVPSCLQHVLASHMLCSITLVSGEIWEQNAVFLLNSPWKSYPFLLGKAACRDAESQAVWGGYSPEIYTFEYCSYSEHPNAEKPEHIMQLLTLIRFKIILNIKQ